MTWCWQQACSTQVLWPRRLSLLDLIRGLFRRTPPFGRECHQRLLVQPFCSEVTLSHENSSLTPTCISPVLRSPSVAHGAKGTLGKGSTGLMGQRSHCQSHSKGQPLQLNPVDSPLQLGLWQKQLFVTLKKKSKKAYSVPRTSTWKVVRLCWGG